MCWSIKKGNQINYFYRVAEYSFYNGNMLTQLNTKSPILLSSLISDKLEVSKPIESVIQIKTETNWKAWYDCSYDEQFGWYKEQKEALNKLFSITLSSEL